MYCSWEISRCNKSAEDQGLDFEAVSDPQNPDKYGQAFNFKDTSETKLNAEAWIFDWDLGKNEGDNGPSRLRRAPAVFNMIADAWIKLATRSDEYRSYLIGTQEMPKPKTELSLEISSLIAGLFVTWVAQLLLPTMLVQLVYEKEENLRIMMRMHGLGDAAYWIVNYSYYLCVYVTYIVVFIIIGALGDFVIFTRNSYSTFLLLKACLSGIFRFADGIFTAFWKCSNCFYFCD